MEVDQPPNPNPDLGFTEERRRRRRWVNPLLWDGASAPENKTTIGFGVVRGSCEVGLVEVDQAFRAERDDKDLKSNYGEVRGGV